MTPSKLNIGTQDSLVKFLIPILQACAQNLYNEILSGHFICLYLVKKIKHISEIFTKAALLTSLGMGWTNVHPDFQNSSKKLFHIDSE